MYKRQVLLNHLQNHKGLWWRRRLRNTRPVSYTHLDVYKRQILEIALGWNYFRLLLETVERYIVVGVLCYTSPLAFSMGASKTTVPVFKSWCRMVGSQLLLLVMNVWFLRGFNSSMGQYIGNGGALSTGQGSIFLWLFCALAFLKTAQKFEDVYKRQD